MNPVRNALCNWQEFLTPGEKQSGSRIETQACVSFAKAQDINAQVDWLIANDRISSDQKAKIESLGFILDGQFQCSARFIAKVSQTSSQGNTLDAVADAVPKYGLLPESDYPSDPGDMDWDDYYRNPTKEEIEKAKEILSILEFPWHYIAVKDIPSALQAAPVQIAIGICPGWESDDPVKTCSAPLRHSTLVYDMDDTKGYYKIFDHYEPYLKNLAPGYFIGAATQTIVESLNKSATLSVNPNLPSGGVFGRLLRWWFGGKNYSYSL